MSFSSLSISKKILVILSFILAILFLVLNLSLFGIQDNEENYIRINNIMLALNFIFLFIIICLFILLVDIGDSKGLFSSGFFRFIFITILVILLLSYIVSLFVDLLLFKYLSTLLLITSLFLLFINIYIHMDFNNERIFEQNFGKRLRKRF